MVRSIVFEDYGIYFVIENDFSDEDLLSFKSEIVRKGITHVKYILWDFSAVTSFSVSSDTIKKLAGEEAIFFRDNPGVKMAVVTKKVIVKGLTNLFGAYFEIAGGQEFGAEFFNSEEEARSWLSVVLATNDDVQ